MESDRNKKQRHPLAETVRGDGHPAFRVASADELAEEVRRGRAAAQAAINACELAEEVRRRARAPMALRVSRLPADRPKPGVCFGCGCTDGEWIDADHTMCSACDGRARRFLAWYRLMERRVRSAAAPKEVR